MSHFSVMVIGADVDRILQPYHEFECTGVIDEFVVFVPAEESESDLREEFEGREDRSLSFEEYIEAYYGYLLKDGKWGRLTNPNAKWDWWVVGGRWSGMLRAKPGVQAGVGRPGLMGSCSNRGDLWVDRARKCDIDWGYMRDHAEREAAERFDKVAEAFALGDLPTWRSVLDKHRATLSSPGAAPVDAADAAREEYNALPVVAKLRELDAVPFLSDPGAYWCGGDRAKFLAQARAEAVTTYAAVSEHGWAARGEMGWFGMSDDKLSKEDWDEAFNKMLDALPDETLITVVDCHI